VRKLIEKKRVGSKIIKRYDEAKTPYRRLLASSDISEEIKMKLHRQYYELNPAYLKRELTRLQNEFYQLNILKQNREKETAMSNKSQSSFEYISTSGSLSSFQYLFS